MMTMKAELEAKMNKNSKKAERDRRAMKREVREVNEKVVHGNEMAAMLMIVSRLADDSDTGKVAIDHQAADGVPADLQKQ
jgi:uncharacterized protein YwgA